MSGDRCLLQSLFHLWGRKPSSQRLSGKLGHTDLEGTDSVYNNTPVEVEDVGADVDDDVAEENADAEARKCCVCDSVTNLKRCSGCKSTWYCSKKCQKSHREYHGVYCSAISQLCQLEINKLFREYTVRQRQVDTKTQAKIVKLVGEKPILSCRLDGKDFDVLWDTGSMISLVGRQWVQKNFPQKEIHSIRDFLEENEELKVTAANSSDISGTQA